MGLRQGVQLSLKREPRVGDEHVEGTRLHLLDRTGETAYGDGVETFRKQPVGEQCHLGSVRGCDDDSWSETHVDPRSAQVVPAE